MEEKAHLNAERFMGFAEIYENARPQCPEKVTEIILKYLRRSPSLVIDLGCGTGLSTRIWSEISTQVIGIEPSNDMIQLAKEKSSDLDNVKYITAFSDNTGLEDGTADIITCSQSFHWMEPETTLREASRLLKEGGIFAVYDCDWPPVCHWEAELEYNKLFSKVNEIESTYLEVKEKFNRWDKSYHLSNMQKSGYFRYIREIVFSNTEKCNSQRFIDLALSQGGLQSVLKSHTSDIQPVLASFKERIRSIMGNNDFEVDFCYRMRIGVK